MWISFFRQKQRKPHTVVPLVILGALQLEDLSAFAGVCGPGSCQCTSTTVRGSVVVPHLP